MTTKDETGVLRKSLLFLKSQDNYKDNDDAEVCRQRDHE